MSLGVIARVTVTPTVTPGLIKQQDRERAYKQVLRHPDVGASSIVFFVHYHPTPNSPLGRQDNRSAQIERNVGYKNVNKVAVDKGGKEYCTSL